MLSPKQIILSQRCSSKIYNWELTFQTLCDYIIDHKRRQDNTIVKPNVCVPAHRFCRNSMITHQAISPSSTRHELTTQPKNPDNPPCSKFPLRSPLAKTASTRDQHRRGGPGRENPQKNAYQTKHNKTRTSSSAL